MEETPTYVVFSIERQRYALALDGVERVVPACEIRRVRDHAKRLLGVLDLAGEVVPVIDAGADPMRERTIGPEDLFLIVVDGDRRAIVRVDAVEGVWTPEPGSVLALDPRARFDGGPVATWRRHGDLILVHHVHALLDGEIISALRDATVEQP